MGSTQIEKNVVWADQDINNKENTAYQNQLKSYKYLKVVCFENVEGLMNYIKGIQFEETIIIISGGLYSEFLESFKKNIKNFFIIPQIIIFTWEERKEELKNKYKDIDTTNSFYHLDGIHTDFESVKKLIIKSYQKRDIEEEYQLTFECIDCKEKLVLPTCYKALIDFPQNKNIEKFNEHIFIKYAKNENINNLFKSIKSIPDIPIELLSRLYARLYTIDSDFYKDLNRDLKDNKKENYLSYIKVLYEGVKLKALPLFNQDNLLYRGSKIANIEIKSLKEYISKKIEGLPGAIVFSESFLSFSKIRRKAEEFLEEKKNDNEYTKVLYIIEKDDNIDYSLSTHADIEDFSKYPEEREVLFFPFSSFEIKEIIDSEFEKETLYIIKLLYLGKYLKEIEDVDEDEDVPDTKFKQELEVKGIIAKEKMEKTKEIIERYKEYEDFINNKEDRSNYITIIYKIEDKNEIKIFGDKFVKHNKLICKILFENREYDLTENFNIFNQDINVRLKGRLNIKLTNIKSITDMSYMFYKCSSLLSLPDIFKWDTEKITNMSNIFCECYSLNVPSISKWNTSNVTDMSGIFQKCINLYNLPDISNWNTSKVVDMNFMFDRCSNLLSLPDISKWDTSNVTKMDFMFYECKSLHKLPNISVWNIDKVISMKGIFERCSKGLEIPIKFSKFNK